LIAEAYTVLSNTQSRAQYDNDHIRHPEILRDDNNHEISKEGVPVARLQNLDRSASAVEHREKIRQIRKAFNLDDLGNSRGGVPHEGMGKIR
jgi:curved DNA-binding protein CbpA